MKLNKKKIAAILTVVAALVAGALKLLEAVPEELPDAGGPEVVAPADAGVTADAGR